MVLLVRPGRRSLVARALRTQAVVAKEAVAAPADQAEPVAVVQVA